MTISPCDHTKMNMTCANCMLLALGHCDESLIMVRPGPTLYYNPFGFRPPERMRNCVHEFNSTHLMADMRMFASCMGIEFDAHAWLLPMEMCS